VQLYHPCLSQVRVTLQGPGSLSGSPNFHSPAYEHEVVLFSELTTNGTGCLGGVHTFQFDDDSARRPEDYNRVYEGVYQPQVNNVLNIENVCILSASLLVCFFCQLNGTA